MNYSPYLLLLLVIGALFEPIQGQCSGGYWPIQNASIGSFTVFWRYNLASNTVQFIIQGQAITSVNLTSTYIALGWSNTAPNMDNMDVAMFFPGTQIVQDRFSRGEVVPSVDSQQDFCVIRTNLTNSNVYVAFERFITTGDPNDISFIPNLYLMFSMGIYTLSNNGTSFNPQHHFFRIAYQTQVNLLNCTASSCLTTVCSIASCPCLQQITTGSAQCVCFPPSSCISGSTVTPRTTVSLAPSASLIPVNNLTTANLCQCSNGGTCLANGTCLCSNLYRGKLCQLNNPCIGYCHNNGSCSAICTDSVCGFPTCTCTNGYSGAQCDNVVTSLCQTNSCVNGNCVMLTNTSYQCQCFNGFLGSQCNLINSCLSNPCNQGTCVVSSNCNGILCGYSCLCPNGVNGTNCQVGTNPCLSTPCQNNGICTALSNSYLCQCLSPYGGTNCGSIINVCTPNPCLNNGVCVRSSSIQTYQCQCLTGYTGTHCEYLNGCTSSPCHNNGQCVTSTTNCSSTSCSISCICSNSTAGVYCEQQLTSCLTISCLNGGTCSMNSSTNTPYCLCPSNTNGIRCETIASVCTNNTCSNHGICYIDASLGNNTVRCICNQGYTGQYCQMTISSLTPCSQNPCGYNGTCLATSNTSYYCMCPNGLTGPSCTPNSTLSCANSPCNYLSQCQPTVNFNSTGYQCICPAYLIGNRCQYTNNCQKQPCYNQGTCVPLGPQNSFRCICQPGFGNFDCSINMGLVCTTKVCLNGGTCVYNSTTIRCTCPPGYAGARCDWTSVCSSNTCANGGTCRQTAATMAECLCASGFSGPTCSLRDSCSNFPCKNGGGCSDLFTDMGNGWSAYRCNCPSGFYGQNCDTTMNSCASLICPSYKICNEQPTGPVCTCTGSQVGTFCQYNDPCTLSPTNYCLNGGTCVSTNTDPPVASCLCPQGFTGSNCGATLQSNPCASNPCQTRGYCALSSGNTSYSCICEANYTGSQCQSANPCSSSPCLNQGICQSSSNTSNTWFTCLCVGAYTGTRCETSLATQCGGLCMNGSPCVNGTCVCPSQYTGTYCGFNNPCYNSICQNNGFCSANYNSTSVSFTCTCSTLYTGQYCENSIYTILQSSTNCVLTCLNGGTCANGMCICTAQYIGPRCQYANPCANGNPCSNGGSCFGQFNTNGSVYTQCFCHVGYTGARCESTICSATSCNGGVCIAAQNSFVCSCPTGKVGNVCQYADACMNNPCPSMQLCQQTANQYQCVSCADRSTLCSVYQAASQYCDSRYSILVNNTYLPVPDACPLSCNKCISAQRMNEMNPLSDTNYDDNATMMEEGYTAESTTTTVMPEEFGMNIILSRSVKCFDERDDCLLQKQYGFCEIFNEKYPYDCAQTCNPNCTSQS